MEPAHAPRRHPVRARALRLAAHVAVVTLAACGGDAPAPPAGEVARADSAALAALPPALEQELAVRAVLTPEALRDTARVRCEPMRAPNASESRRRLRALLPDSAPTVLFVRARRVDGAVRRVELVRRVLRGGQRGFIWDAATDEVQSVVWAPGSARPETTVLPRAGPMGPALRALGRRLLALPCPA